MTERLDKDFTYMSETEHFLNSSVIPFMTIWNDKTQRKQTDTDKDHDRWIEYRDTE